MKAMDLLLMLLTANIMFMILGGIGCYTSPGTVNLSLSTLGMAELFGTGVGVSLIIGALAVVGILGRQLNPVAYVFAIGFYSIWAINVNVLAGFIGITSYFPWYTTLFVNIVGSIISVLGALELHTGVRL